MNCSFCGTTWPGEMSPDEPMLSRLAVRRERSVHTLRVIGSALAFGTFTALIVIAAQSLLRGM